MLTVIMGVVSSTYSGTTWKVCKFVFTYLYKKYDNGYRCALQGGNISGITIIQHYCQKVVFSF